MKKQVEVKVVTTTTTTTTTTTVAQRWEAKHLFAPKADLSILKKSKITKYDLENKCNWVE